jgi:hypothetical protein
MSGNTADGDGIDRVPLLRVGIIAHMGELGARLDRLVINAFSPDGNLTSEICNRIKVDLRFAPGAYARYDAAVLAHQLDQLAALTWTRYRREYLEIAELVLGELRHDGFANAAEAEFWTRQEQLTVAGASPSGAVSVRSRALVCWRFQIGAGALERLPEPAFVAEVRAAVADLLADHRSQLALLRDELYGSHLIG